MKMDVKQSTHRSIDVDRFDENKYTDSDVTEDFSTEVKTRTATLRQMISQGQGNNALKEVAKDPLYTASQTVKDDLVKVAGEVFSSFRSADIKSAVQSLTEEELDVVLKYVFRCMEMPQHTNCATVLGFHKAIVEAGGEGAIVRVMMDRQRV
eukprot:CFRG7808T1